MTVRIVSRWVGVVYRKVAAHSFGYEMFLAVFPEHLRTFFKRHFPRQGKHETPCKLCVPLLLRFFGGVPERRPVCIFRRSVCRKQDFRVNNFGLFPAVIFGFLVILGEQLLSGLIGCSCNGGAALAALDDADIQMGNRHFVESPFSAQ